MAVAGSLVVAGAAVTDVQARVDQDVGNGLPIVAHVVVALCDTVHQGIVPVSKALGGGQNPRTNLYWGAAFGVRTFFTRDKEFRRVQLAPPALPEILDRVAFVRTVEREGHTVELYMIAEA